MEARRKLSEKYRARGFWHISEGKSKGFKGKSKGKSSTDQTITNLPIQPVQKSDTSISCPAITGNGTWMIENHDANSPASQVDAQNDLPPESSCRHERFGASSSADPAYAADPRDGVSRSLVTGRIESRDGEVRQESHGKDLHRSVGDLPGLGSMVSGPLPEQQECRAQESDPIDQAEDRGSRSSGRGVDSGSHPSQEGRSPMAGLELALHQILEHLAPKAAGVPLTETEMHDNLPELPLASEWEDPWTA